MHWLCGCSLKKFTPIIHTKFITTFIIALRDNGKNFNPVEYSVAEEENLHTDGIMLLKNLAKEIKYHRVLSLNQTVIEI